MDNTHTAERERERERMHIVCHCYYTLGWAPRNNGRSTEWIPSERGAAFALYGVMVMADAGAMRTHTRPRLKYKLLCSKFPLGFALGSMVLRSYIENANISNLQTHTFSLFTRERRPPARTLLPQLLVCTRRSQLMLPIQSGPSENKDGRSTGLMILWYGAATSNLAKMG